MSDSSEPIIDAPVADAPVVDAPVVDDIEIPDDIDLDTPLVDAPVVDEPVEEADPFEAFGGREKIAEAQRVYELTQTDEGVVQLFIEAGRSLGLSFEQMEALFNAQQAAGAPVEDDEDLDAPLTKREWMEQQRAAQAAAAEAAAAQSRQGAVAAAQQSIAATFAELGVEMDSEAAKVVLQFGDQHFDRQNPTPENVRAAVLRGHAEYTAFLDKQSREYLKAKREKAASVPKAPVGASAPATAAPDEPKSAAEAAARVRARLGY